MPRSWSRSCRDSSRPVSTTTGTSASAASACIRSISSKPLDPGSSRSTSMMSGGPASARSSSSIACAASAAAWTSQPRFFSSRATISRTPGSSSTTSARPSAGAASRQRSTAPQRVSRSMGLDRKASAPRAKASGVSSNIDTMMTAVSRRLGSSLMAWRVCQPSRPGISRSKVTAEGRSSRAMVRPSSPLEAATTRWPCISSIRVSSRRASRSSSMTSTSSPAPGAAGSRSAARAGDSISSASSPGFIRPGTSTVKTVPRSGSLRTCSFASRSSQKRAQIDRPRPVPP